MPNRKPHPPLVPPKDTGAGGGVGINSDFILDSFLIPSLPAPGGRIGHHDLMGIPNPRVVYGSVPNLNLPPLPSGVGSAEGGGGGGGKGMLSVPRPNIVRRSSSFEDRLGHPSNSAGVGARGMTIGTPVPAGAASTGHARNLSTGSVETARYRPIPGKGKSSVGGGRMIDVERERPGMLRTTSSLEAVPMRKGNSRTHQEGSRDSHSRTSSDTLVQAPALSHSNTAAKEHSGNSSNGGETGLLHLTKDDIRLTKTLTTLLALIPADRIPHPPPPKPNTNTLHPYSLLTPMTIVLEALVCEREVLKGTSSKRILPLLRDGSSLQLPFQTLTPAEQDLEGSEIGSGSGELDWSIVKAYIIAMGSILNTLLPYLRELPSDSSQSQADSKVPHDLLKTLRTYVGKMKKVFGEVASMYVDEYSFVRGWWDESGMKGAAGEVGRWGDLFDA